MSVLERLNKQMKITTGDGRVYLTLTQAQIHKGGFEFNISEFEYPGIKGTHVDRRLRKGVRYPLEFYFQGDDVDEQREAFLASSEDTRYWVVEHPKYGNITCHPISIEWDDSGIYNCKFNIEVVETIINGGPRTTLAPGQNVFGVTQKSRTASAIAFSSSVNPETSDVQMMGANVNGLFDDAATSIGNDLDYTTYTNLYNEAITNINSSFNDVSNAILSIQSFITQPSLFIQSVKDRFKILLSQAQTLSTTLINLTDSNKKKIFESQKIALISAIVDTAASPQQSDYENSVDVFDVISLILGAYNTFIDELQEITTVNPNDPDPYIPDSESYSNLNYAVNYAVSNLMEIALSAKQERVVLLPEDTNVVLIAHRFYGLQPDDSTIKKIIENNQIGMDEFFQLKKDRKIKYYI